MMVSPESYVAQFEGLSLMELAVERDRLFYDIGELRSDIERGYVAEGMDPSPEVVLSVKEDYLSAMDALVARREAEEGCSVADLPLPEGFVAACEKVYGFIGPVYMAEEVLGHWVFDTTCELTISGPVGVSISTGELVHFHVPSLIIAAEEGGQYAREVEEQYGFPAKTVLDELGAEHARRPVYRVPDRFRS